MASKHQFYDKMVRDLKASKPHQWYSKLKRMTAYDHQKQEHIEVGEISQLSAKEQVEILADKFSSISNQYDEVEYGDINIPNFCQSTIPVFTSKSVSHILIPSVQIRVTSLAMSLQSLSKC